MLDSEDCVNSSQMRAVVLSILLDDAGKAERDEFLLVAIQERIAKGTTHDAPPVH